MSYFLCVIGMVMIIEGLPYFVFPDQIKGFTRKILDMEEKILRQGGFLLVVIGLILVYIGRS